MKRNWKRVRPTSLLNAMELCVEHARETRNAGVDRIASRMGEEHHHNLYKYLHNGRMPLVKLHAFEEATGAAFVTRWLAMQAELRAATGADYAMYAVASRELMDLALSGQGGS